MKKNLSKKEKQLYQCIARILWEHWDPIGVRNDDNVWDDEYDGYVPSLFKLAIENRDESKIANHLRELSRVSMSVALNENSEKEATVAKLIIEAKDRLLADL